ncbi:MAG: pyruvate kinase [Candidatus Omnitrophica bacterium]|nr:pyruvate kinase [Candidatus Omnitrophota bacterium]
MVRTKIIATLGPSSSQESVLRKMFTNGLDIVRLNFSHGTHQQHLEMVKIIRSLNKKMRRRIKIMQDLEGYRIRIGNLLKPVMLTKGHKFYLTQEEVLGNEYEVSFDYSGSLRKVKKGSSIYIDDGRIILKVIDVEKKRLKTRTMTTGLLSGHKGVNMLGVELEFSALTDKDKTDVKIAIKEKLDYVAQSFVRDARDLRLLKSIVKVAHPECEIFAKIENQKALNNLDEIIDEADGIIVARGDLGICVPIYKVPVIQKEIIKRCRIKNKPVVVATQMLDSMTENILPTRAEVSDVANAILDGATGLLISGETAVGRHPEKVVDMMNKIIKNTEKYEKGVKK